MAAADLSAGSVIAQDFRVVRPLGRGGMGVVYLVEQLSTGKRRALKVMQDDVAQDSSARERFVQEAKVGAMIESEHVVEAIAAGVDAAHGLQWLAMELLDGEDLAAYVRRRGPLPPSEAAEVLEQLCRGLAAAHAMRIVHRDLKPENVFLARRPREAAVLVKLLDFGIAKVMRVDLTATGAVGTPLWMAPEQSSSRAHVTPATDVWALGLIVFYLLVGRPYWRQVGSAMELMREVLFEPLAAASARAKELGSDAAFPPDLEAWFARAVARDAETRFADAGQAWEALAPVLAAMPGQASKIVLAESPGWATPVAPSPYDPTLPAPTPTGDPASDDTLLDSRDRRARGEEAARGEAGPRAAVRAQPGTGTSAGIVAPPARPAPRASRAVGLAVAASLVVVAGGFAFFAARARGAFRSRAADTPNTLARLPDPRDALTGRMIHFDGGTFMMGFDGTPQTSPRHEVTVGPFDLDETEVTVRAYALCMAVGECSHPYAEAESNSSHRDRADHPVNYIDWSAARGFCAWAGKRLPTEAEWELAAAGGAAQRKYPWGDREPGDDVCWNRSLKDGSTCPVGSSPGDRTPEGLFDMGGNVLEWTESRYCAYSDPQCLVDAGLPVAMRAARGGQWVVTRPALLSPWFRSMVPDVGANEFMGVRCAR